MHVCSFKKKKKKKKKKGKFLELILVLSIRNVSCVFKKKRKAVKQKAAIKNIFKKPNYFDSINSMGKKRTSKFNVWKLEK